MGNALAARIEEELRPIIGIVLARVSVELESKRVGKDPETITLRDVPYLADNLAMQLRLVVGEEMAESAARRVRAIT